MVQQVLQRFGFTYSSPQSTPLPTGHSLSAPPSDECVEPSGPYPELVGCLMYLMTCTRPDLAYPLTLLARYVALGRHRKVHWDAARRVLRYLCSTLGMELVLGGRARVVLTGHADASWVDDLATQRSSQGYTFSLGVTLAHLPADRLGRGASFSSTSPRSPPVLYLVPLSPFSPLLLLLLLLSSLVLRRSGLRLLLVGGAATARARGARVVEGTVGAVVEAVEEAEGVAVEVGMVAGVGALVAVVAAVEAAAAVVEVAAAAVLVEVDPRSVEALVVASASSSRVPVRPRRPCSFNAAIFDLDFDAILAAMYAVTDSAEGDCYMCVPPDPSIEAAALGASESTAPGTGESAAPGAGESALSGTAPTEALHTLVLRAPSFATSPHSRRLVGLLQSPWLTPLGAQSLRTLPRFYRVLHPVGLAVGTPPPLVLHELGEWS
ncbi:unnamed protein product [Closterium sp. NIES-54]